MSIIKYIRRLEQEIKIFYRLRQLWLHRLELVFAPMLGQI